MKKQLQIYSLDTKVFYTKEENEIHNKLSWMISEKIAIEEYVLFNIVSDKKILSVKDITFLDKYRFEDYCCFKYQKEEDKYLRTFITKLFKDNKALKKSDDYKEALSNFPLHKEYSTKIKETNKLLIEILKNSDKTIVRKLNSSSLTKYNKISIFESSFSRTLDLKFNETSTDIFIVKVKDKKFYPVMEQLVNNSFTILNCDEQKYDRYIALTSTAGQIRLQKVIFIKESIYKQYEKTFMCGLTIEDINNSELHGCNVNKFLAYLGLIFTDSDKWDSFDINDAIVIDDFETNVSGWVDFIDAEFNVTPKQMGVLDVLGVPISHSDGCGWILSSESKVNFQFRAPWMKGLLTPVNFLSYCKTFNDNNYKVIDIYGKEWDLKADGIKYVFSKSQFKMSKYYPNVLDADGEVIKFGWDTYKDNFTKYNCHASKCHEESGTFKTGRFNYQMMQTLTDIEPEELDELITPTKDLISSAYTNKDTMLEVLGAGKFNVKKNNLQQALEIYPELLHDAHVQEELMETISAKRNDAKFSRIKINAKSTFILPDIFAWLQFVFSNDKSIAPKGLLDDGEVYCKLYKKSPKLLCNRSPALYKEHAVRENIANKFNSEWFCTDGLYASSHDLISKILQYDVDGDSSLVIADPLLISIAERNMKDVLPLYYVMGKAEPEIITNKSMYESINKAWKFGNIGTYSNTLTKFWNNYNEDSELDTAKIICCLNNFSIDAAKTKLMPKVPKEIREKIKAIKELEMPYFAQFAKDKLVDKVADRNTSTVNILCEKIEAIKTQKYDYSGVGNFRSAKLMHNPKIVINEAVADKYDELNKLKDSYFMRAGSAGQTKDEVSVGIYTQIKSDLLAEFPTLGIVEITDMIIKHVYKNHRASKKSFLFNCFGDIIVENLKNKTKKPLDDGYFQCSCCGKRVKKSNAKQIMCKPCAKKADKEKARLRVKASRSLKPAI